MRRLLVGALVALYLTLMATTAFAAVSTAPIASGTVVTDNAGTGPGSSTDTSLNAISGTNTMLVVLVASGGSSANTGTISVTWNSTSVPAVTGTLIFDGGATATTQIFCLANPATGAKNLTVSWTGTGPGNIDYVGYEFSGADQTTPCQHGTSGASTTATASLPVTSATGNTVIAIYGTTGTNFSTFTGASLFTNTAGNFINDCANTTPGAATTTISYTQTATSNWAQSAVDIVASGGGPPPTAKSYATFFGVPAL